MAQALCLRLLSLKFQKMVSFALNVNVMRSAYSACLPRHDADLMQGGRLQLATAGASAGAGHGQAGNTESSWMLNGY